MNVQLVNWDLTDLEHVTTVPLMLSFTDKSVGNVVINTEMLKLFLDRDYRITCSYRVDQEGNKSAIRFNIIKRDE